MKLTIKSQVTDLLRDYLFKAKYTSIRRKHKKSK